eukprot:359402-Chlamydomonas_euryale.AAC.6
MCRPVNAHHSGGAIVWKLGLSDHCPAVLLGGLTDLATRRGQESIARGGAILPAPRDFFCKILLPTAAALFGQLGNIWLRRIAPLL